MLGNSSEEKLGSSTADFICATIQAVFLQALGKHLTYQEILS